jgi:hypothetical protein
MLNISITSPPVGRPAYPVLIQFRVFWRARQPITGEMLAFDWEGACINRVKNISFSQID